MITIVITRILGQRVFAFVKGKIMEVDFMNKYDEPLTRVSKINLSENGELESFEVEKTPELMDLLASLNIGVSHTMGRTVDVSLFFPETDYQKATKSWWQRFIDWKVEIQHRIDLAIEVLRGKHNCDYEY